MIHRKRSPVPIALALSLAVCWIFVSGMARGRAEARLPSPADVPCAPDGAVAPGGAALPSLIAQAATDAPAISAISDVTFPDETLVVTGDRLDGASLRVWMEGRMEDLAPMRTAANRLQAVVPKGWPLSTMLVWPVRGQQAGTPIRVNGATAWWVWPARLAQLDAVAPTSALVMGKNLKLGSAKPCVHLKGPGTILSLPVLAAQPYQLTVQLPGGLQAGTYQLFAHNGTGGIYGWSEPSQLEVFAAPLRDKLASFDVARFDAKPDDGLDDAPAIQQAVDAAAKAGGGTVRFAAGVYHLGSTITLSDVPGAGIHMVGMGMGQYDAKAQTVGRPSRNPRLRKSAQAATNSANHCVGCSASTSLAANEGARRAPYPLSGPPVKTQAAGGHGTVLRFLPGSPALTHLVHVACRFSSLRDLTLIHGHEGIVRAIHDRKARRQVVVRVTRHDVTLERMRLVLVDLRPQVPPEKRQDLHIYDAALHLLAPGKSNLLVRDCEFHSAGAGIEIGDLPRGHTEDGFPDPSTDYVRIEKCLFRGYSPGFYKEPAHPGSYQHMGVFNEGVQVFNGKYVIIQGCDFAGADRRGRKGMNRSICVCNTSVRDLFIAENRSHDVGMVCPRDDRAVNQGEQILFHFMYPHGGYFDVLDAAPTRVAVNPDDPRAAGKLASPHTAFTRVGSRVLEEVGANDHWIVFVSSGKGVGQYRVVVGSERQPARIALKLDRPWRVVPDRSSRITLTTANRQNIIFGNTIDAGFIDPRCKVAGILFWFNGFENVIAGNTLRNLGYGIGFNSAFRNPCCWNLVRDNVAEHLGGMAVESVAPAVYFDSCRTAGGPAGPLFQPGSDVAGWYAVGNVARSNQGDDSPVAAFVHALTTDAGSRQLPVQEEAGVVMPVLENSRFTGVKQGIVINRGAVWPVLRNNVVKPLDPSAPGVYDQSR